MTTVAQSHEHRNAIVYYTHLSDVYGIAWKDDTGACWFRAESDGGLWLLQDEDRPYLLLHGRLALIETQALLDSIHGGLFEHVDYRNSEHAQVA